MSKLHDRGALIYNVIIINFYKTRKFNLQANSKVHAAR